MGSSPALLRDLPAGYFVEESPRGMLALAAGVARSLHEAGFGPEQDGPLEVSDLAGRRPLLQMEIEGESFVVRRYHRGGLFRWFFPRTSLDPERPFRELVLADALARSGVRTPEVVAARAVRWARDTTLSALRVGWRLELVTRRVHGAMDMAEVLEAMRRGEVPRAARAALLRAAGAAVRSLHQVGFRHSDLTPRNLLVRSAALRGAAPEVWVIDLDGSSFVQDIGASERRRNLRRLYRAVRRREGRGTPFLSRADHMRFLAGYDPDRRRRKEDWRAVATGHLLAAPLHALGWFFERVFGGGPDTRDGRAVVRG